MLSSLFGDLRPLRGARSDGHADFAATALLEREVTDAAPADLSHQQDLVVSGSPALAIRAHYAQSRADLDTANRQITLVDPTGAWGPLVIKALSDATGRPIERLHLREQGTLRTLAVIQRTTVERRNEPPMRLYHTDVREPGDDNATIPIALMERSHMAAVIVASMAPGDIDRLLDTLQHAVLQPNWRCPTLMFMLPPNAVAVSNKIAMIDWPEALRVQVLNESLTSAAAVWNALLGIWNRVKTVPTWMPAQAPNEHGIVGFPIRVADLPAPEPDAASAPVPGQLPSLPARDLARAIAAMSAIEGLLGCAVVDTATGIALARHAAQTTEPLHLERAAASSAQVLRTQQLAAAGMGLVEGVEEITTCSARRHHLLRTVSGRPGFFLFAVLDKQKANLALARYKLMEAEHLL